MKRRLTLYHEAWYQSVESHVVVILPKTESHEVPCSARTDVTVNLEIQIS